jgi:hypothetical protein
MPIILATQEAEIRIIVVQSQPWATSSRDLSQKTLHKQRTGGVTVGPKFKPQYRKKRKQFRWGSFCLESTEAGWWQRMTWNAALCIVCTVSNATTPATLGWRTVVPGECSELWY